MIIDLHTHTTTSSLCSILTPMQLLQRAKALGLDAVAVTDHGTLHGAQVAHELGQRHGLLVLRGQEIHSSVGDVLVFGFPHDLGDGTDFFDLADGVHRAGGIVILAHPFRSGTQPVSSLATARPIRFRLDAIEVLNMNCSAEQNRAASDLARKWRIPAVGGSDAHTVGWVGRYVTTFPRPVRDETDLIEAIRSGHGVAGAGATRD